MKRLPDTLIPLFHAGKLHELVQATVLSGGYAPDSNVTPLIVASLGLLGRLHEADLLLQSQARSLSGDGVLLGIFHLVQASAHQAQYARARRYIGQAFALRRQATSPVAKFYLHQSFAFYRFVTGRLPLAFRAAQRAANTLPRTTLHYESYLSNEQRGHLLVLTGHAAEGCALLRNAQAQAKKLNRAASIQSLAISLTLYEARYSLPYKKAIATLSTCLATLPAKDRLNRASIHLETTRQHALARQTALAKESLQASAQTLVGLSSRRYEVAFLLRQIEVMALVGEVSAAAVIASSAVRLLDQEADLLLKTELLSHQIALFKAMESPPALATLEGELVRFLLRTGLALPGTPSATAPSVAQTGALNLRQVTLLREMSAGDAMDVQSYKRRFDVSEITASRDLANLSRWGYLQRLGKARATRYLKAQVT